jgi:anti-sigma factor RsiW
MGRPTDVLTCYRARRRLGAYLDGALSEGDAGWTDRHVTGCASCRREIGQLRRLKALVAESAAAPEPDWTGFWPGIVRGIEDERRRVARMPTRRVWSLWPQWAVGSAAVAAVALSLIFWQGARGPMPAEAAVLVNSATTEHPTGTVMVYTPPDHNLAVVWLFDND